MIGAPLVSGPPPVRPVTREPSRGLQSGDVAVAVCLFALSIAYVLALPPVLGPADEGSFLYTSKMVLHGRALYRDVFEIVAPGWFYLMAAVFRVFGATITSVRAVNATLHALIVTTCYLIARVITVRRTLAAPLALVHLAILQPVWMESSPHWLCTWLSLALLFIVLQRGRGWMITAGITAGLLLSVMQQIGILFVASVAGLLAGEALRGRRRAARARPLTALLGPLAWFTAGVLIATVPLMVAVIRTSGFSPVWAALVQQPLVNYRRVNRTTWASVNLLTAKMARYTYPSLLRYAPVLIPVVIGLIVVSRRDASEFRRHGLLITAFAALSVLSILYYPDFIHVAFIGSSMLILLSWCAEWLLRRLPVAAARVAGPVLAVALLLAVGIQLRRNVARAHAEFAVIAPTSFGTIAFANPATVALANRVRELSAESSPRDIYFYPAYPAMYLMTGTENPTPYQELLPGYSPPEQFDQVIAILDTRKIRYVGVLKPLITKRADPVFAYIAANYDLVADRNIDPKSGVTLYRRRPDRST